MGNIPGLSVEADGTDNLRVVTQGIGWEMFNSTDENMEVLITAEQTFLPAAVAVLAESLLRRGADADLQKAEAAVESLAAVANSGYRLYDLFLRRLRALLARARGDEARFRGFVDSYREMAEALDIKRHIAIANEMCD
jgi:adenylate cyclase